MFKRLAGLLALVVIAQPARIEAQGTVVVPDRPTCAQCAIGLDSVLTLQTASGRGALVSSPKSVAMDRRGRFYVADWGDASLVHVYDPKGNFVTRLGREGQGPGEFSRIDFLRVGPMDSLYVFERYRVQVFDSTGSFSRSFNLSGRKYDARIGTDGVVMAASIPTRQRVGFPLHDIVGGEVVRSYGVSEEFRPDRMDWGAVVLDGGVGENVYSVMRNQYVVDWWSSDREHRSRLVRETSWFPATVLPDVAPTRKKPRPPLVMGVEVNDGVAVVLISVPHPKWESVVPDPIQVEGEWVLPIGDGEGYFQTRVEAIDVSSGRLLQWRQVPIEIYGFVARGLTYAARRRDDGTYDTVVERVRLEEPH